MAPTQRYRLCDSMTPKAEPTVQDVSSNTTSCFSTHRLPTPEKKCGLWSRTSTRDVTNLVQLRDA